MFVQVVTAFWNTFYGSTPCSSSSKAVNATTVRCFITHIMVKDRQRAMSVLSLSVSNVFYVF